MSLASTIHHLRSMASALGSVVFMESLFEVRWGGLALVLVLLLLSPKWGCGKRADENGGFPTGSSQTSTFFQILQSMEIASTLDSLKRLTTIVADTGDFALMEKYNPRTPPPTLPSSSSQPGTIRPSGRQSRQGCWRGNNPADKLLVSFGLEILKIIPGRVSTEVPAHLSFDADAAIKARELIALYENEGIDRASSSNRQHWEGSGGKSWKKKTSLLLPFSSPSPRLLPAQKLGLN